MEFGQHDNWFTISFDDDERSEWIRGSLFDDNKVTVGKAFTIAAENVIEGLHEDDFGIVIRIGRKVGEYWEMDKSVLGIEYHLYLGIDCNWSRKHFVAEKGVRIFPKLNGVVENSIWIGGNNKDAMPYSVYDQIIRKLPNYTELNKYVKARLSGVIGEYFNVIGNAQLNYEKYLNKKIGKRRPNTPDNLVVNEQAKFTYLIDKLTDMLEDAVSFSEATWQNEIVSIIRLLFPKYILPLESVKIRDLKGKRREIDIGLLDVEGNIDIIEIKKPFDECIMSKTKYRDNHVPLRELSGAVMQAEKYILYLQRGGPKMDEYIQEQFSDLIPHGLSVKIVNPHAMIIMGRSNNLNPRQQTDFEVVKRKYKNIADIITYDDMIERLRVLRDAITFK